LLTDFNLSRGGWVTYNFDPDRWYDDERGILDARLMAGEMDAQEYNDALSALERRYDEMLTRLDGMYQIPKSPRTGR
jgi:hypothetical protein